MGEITQNRYGQHQKTGTMKKLSITYWTIYLAIVAALSWHLLVHEWKNHRYWAAEYREMEEFRNDSIVDSLICHGNTVTYDEFCATYTPDSVGTTDAGRLWTYSFIMSNKYSYAPANYMVYRILTDFYQVNGIEEDEAMRELTTHYLQKGAELGDERCLSVLKRIDEMD